MTKQQKRFYIVGPLLMFFATFSGVAISVLEWFLKSQHLIAKKANLATGEAFKLQGYEFTLPLAIGAFGLLITSHEFIAWVIEAWKGWRYEARSKKNSKQRGR